MFAVSRRADYGVRAMLHLASLPPGSVASASDIAGCQAIPGPFLAKILARLRSAGLVCTERGLAGGATLARPAAEISLLDVVTALEGAIEMSRCIAAPGRCPLAPRCQVRGVWCRVQATLSASLAAVTLDQLLPNATDLA